MKEKKEDKKDRDSLMRCHLGPAKSFILHLDSMWISF